MPDLESVIDEELKQLRVQDLYRNPICLAGAQGPIIRIDGREFVNFSSNDYLGLNGHPALRETAQRAIADFGVGAGASRLICGSLSPHRELEEALAGFKGTEAALLFATGYAATNGVITSLLGRDDVIIVDKLVHASVVDAARLSGARLRVFHHNHLADLEKKLAWASTRHPGSRVLIVTESVFSMDGDLAPLLNIVELKERFGAWLMVDEAHATGLFGERRSGLVEEFGLTDRIEIQLVTLGKALGVAGGAVCGRRSLIDLLINRARPFIYSTAPPPAQAAAAKAAVELVQTSAGQELRQRLWAMVEHLKTALLAAGLAPGVVRSPIVPIIIGSETAALGRFAALRNQGVFVPAIRFPTVARNSARLRFTITAGHTLEHLAVLVAALSHPAPPDESLRQT
jgi:8-amino-7-oxononanoate synthase